MWGGWGWEVGRSDPRGRGRQGGQGTSKNGWQARASPLASPALDPSLRAGEADHGLQSAGAL